MGFTDLFLRKSSGKAISPSQYDKKLLLLEPRKLLKL